MEDNLGPLDVSQGSVTTGRLPEYKVEMKEACGESSASVGSSLLMDHQMTDVS